MAPSLYELRLKASARAWPEIESLIEAAGALSITQSDGGAAIFDEPGDDDLSAWSHFLITALFEHRAAAEGAREQLVATGVADAISIAPLANQDWAQAWRQHWQPQIFAGGLCVCPSWCEAPDGVEVVVELDPGQAFGTGTHASTALCLNWLGSHADSLKRKSIIDYGCGSAILAVAAAKLGAASVHAVDIDVQAVAVALDNVERNDCASTVVVSHSDALPDLSADLLIAKILFEPLRGLRDTLVARLKADGELLLAGLLIDQAEALMAHYRPLLSLEVVASEDEWALLYARRARSAPD